MADLDLVVGSGKIKGVAGGIDGDVLVSEYHARYGRAALAKRLYFSYSSAVATSLAATAAIGNIVWNPPGSGVRLILTKWTSQIVATSATCTGIALAFGYQTTTPTTTTAATATGSSFINQVVAVPGLAKAYGIATVLTAGVTGWVLHHNTAAIATVGEDTQAGDLEGMFVIDQGGFVHMCALGTAAAASGHTSSLAWYEAPVGA